MGDPIHEALITAARTRSVDIHPSLLPAGPDDEERSRLMSLFWARVPPSHQTVLDRALEHREPATRAGESWRNVFWFVFVPPTASVHLFCSRPMRWRMYGAGIPFYQEGWTDGYVKLYVGWGVGFVSVDVLAGPQDGAAAVFEAFPGPKPEPPPVLLPVPR